MKKKNKIFIFNPYPAIGGVDTTIKKFIFSLPNNYQVEYLSLKKTENFRKNNIKNTVINSNSTFVKAEYLTGDISDRVINNLFVGENIEI